MKDEIYKFLKCFKNTAGNVGANFNVEGTFLRVLVGSDDSIDLLQMYDSLGDIDVSNIPKRRLPLFVMNNGFPMSFERPVFGNIGLEFAKGAMKGAISFWEKKEMLKNVAKDIVREYSRNNVLDNCIEKNAEYWEYTKKAFNKALEKLERDFNDYVSNLNKEVYE